MSAIGEFDEMTRTERVRAALRGEEVDRIPVAFWHHFRPEGSGRRQAELTLGFFDEQFDLDICKIMPDIPYPFPRKSITDANGWRMLEPLDLARSPFVQQRLRTIEFLRDELGERHADRDDRLRPADRGAELRCRPRDLLPPPARGAGRGPRRARRDRAESRRRDGALHRRRGRRRLLLADGRD